jgi:hypothetical protein
MATIAHQTMSFWRRLVGRRDTDGRDAEPEPPSGPSVDDPDATSAAIARFARLPGLSRHYLELEALCRDLAQSKVFARLVSALEAGDRARASRLYAGLLRQAETRLGNDHLGVALILELMERNQNRSAREVVANLTRILAIRLRRQGPHHPDTLNTCFVLGLAPPPRRIRRRGHGRHAMGRDLDSPGRRPRRSHGQCAVAPRAASSLPSYPSR